MEDLRANELRIGNLLSFSGEPVAINAGFIHDCDYWNKNPERQDAVSFENVEPIPLTAEWLKKLGWKYYNGRTEGILTMDFGCKMDVDYKDGKLLIKSHYEGEDLYRDTRIKYVHQLQNLFFCLCGEELTIKEVQK